ncbi:MAG: hypothetical protein KJO07_21390 [Deltaproteobacteria bacterium]|nr:hypothetical protein [Deltaproteobacteria bacterium]
MLRLAFAVILGCSAVSALAACDFEQPEPPCTFLCGGEDDDACPDGYSCVTGADEGDPSQCVRDDLVDDEGIAACSEEPASE